MGVRTAAILPVKRFPLAKQRLGESVADSLRADLARAMVGDVLSSLRECSAIDATIVVTCEPSVAAAARYIGAIVVDDATEEGQSAAASLGLAKALEEGFERALCVPGDCPTLDPDELTQLLGGEPNRVVIVPDRHGSGTNGLLLTPPDAISPSFGPDSRARHERLAEEAAASWRIEQTRVAAAGHRHRRGPGRVARAPRGRARASAAHTRGVDSRGGAQPRGGRRRREDHPRRDIAGGLTRSAACPPAA